MTMPQAEHFALYTHAQQHAIWVNLNTKGRIIATDRDRLELPNRLSTNHLTRLKVGEWSHTVFTTSIARIIDRATVLNAGEEAIYITGEGRSVQLLNWLRRNIFFNDRLQLRDAMDELAIIGVYGAKAQAILGDLGYSSPDLHQFAEQDGLRVAHMESTRNGGGYWLIGSPEKIAECQARLETVDVRQSPMEVYEMWRIEAGQAGTPNEINEEYIPLEVGLWDAVSFNKGCYTGQEIIARMESRGKLARTLMQVTLSAEIPAGTPLQDATGRTVGTLTSVAPFPAGIKGLAVIKTSAANPNDTLYAQSDPAVEIVLHDLAGSYERT
jgi:tRNA-modifying protein YgfZ